MDLPNELISHIYQFLPSPEEEKVIEHQELSPYIQDLRFKTLDQQFPHWRYRPKDALLYYAEHENLNLFKMIDYSSYGPRKSHEIFKIIAKTGNIEFFNYFWNQSSFDPYDMGEIAAQHGHLELIKLIFAFPMSMPEVFLGNVIINSIIHNHIEIMDWGLSQGGKMKYVIEGAVKANRWDIFQWAFNNGMKEKYYIRIIQEAISQGNLRITQGLLSLRYKNFTEKQWKNIVRVIRSSANSKLVGLITSYISKTSLSEESKETLYREIPDMILMSMAKSLEEGDIEHVEVLRSSLPAGVFKSKVERLILRTTNNLSILGYLFSFLDPHQNVIEYNSRLGVIIDSAIKEKNIEKFNWGIRNLVRTSLDDLIFILKSIGKLSLPNILQSIEYFKSTYQLTEGDLSKLMGFLLNESCQYGNVPLLQTTLSYYQTIREPSPSRRIFRLYAMGESNLPNDENNMFNLLGGLSASHGFLDLVQLLDNIHPLDPIGILENAALSNADYIINWVMVKYHPEINSRIFIKNSMGNFRILKWILLNLRVSPTALAIMFIRDIVAKEDIIEIEDLYNQTLFWLYEHGNFHVSGVLRAIERSNVSLDIENFHTWLKSLD